MIRLLTAVLLFAGFHAAAEVTLTDINNNEVADAEEVMGNFIALKRGVETNAAAIDALPAPPTNCATDQIIKWGGSAWICANDPLANLTGCTDGDLLVYVGGAVACDCSPPGTAITDSNFENAISNWFSSGDLSVYGPISEWCTGDVTDMSEAFMGAGNFNADISGWDTGAVTDMSDMFKFATSFDQDIGGWDVSNVALMDLMFHGASAFNQDIGSWDVSNLQSMSQMFFQASAFNQDLSSWSGTFLPVAVCTYFAEGATAWLAAYDGSIANKNPPLSAGLIAAGCGE